MKKTVKKTRTAPARAKVQPPRFDCVVFAGGGSRCLWEAGFWDVASAELGLKPRVVAGVSAGAAIAVLLFTGRSERGLNYFKKITALNKKNFYPSGLVTGRKAFPHYDMYRSVILESLDAKSFAALKKGPEIRILLSRPPRWLGPRSATFVGLMTYTLEKKISYPVHPRYSAKLGFRPEVVSAQSCATPGELADLILASSCTPPFVPIMYWDGRVSLDGGLIDNVPVAAVGEEESRNGMLVMLTRQYREERIPRVPGRVYVQPSVPISVTKWDYTSPSGLQEAYDLGRRDAEKFVHAVRQGK